MIKMNRVGLLSALSICAAALDKDSAGIESCFCFNNGTVYAFNRYIAVTVPLPESTGFSGGIPGDRLKKWIASAKGADVVFEVENAVVKIKCGSAKITEAFLPPQSFIFNLPNQSNIAKIEDCRPFVEALAKVIPIMGDNPALKWQYGVTVDFSDENVAVLYASNNISIGKAISASTTTAEHPNVILPPDFSKLIISLAKDGMYDFIGFNETWALAQNQVCSIFSRLSTKTNMDEYLGVFQLELYERCVRNLRPFAVSIDQSETLLDAVQRAMLVVGVQKDPIIRLDCKGGRIQVKAMEKNTESVDEINFSDQHPDFVAELNPKELINGLPLAQQMGVAESVADGVRQGAILLRGDNVDRLISLLVDAE